MASIAGATGQTSTWIATSEINWAQSTNGRAWDISTGSANDPWDVNPLWNGTDNLVFNNNAQVFMQHAETVQNMTVNGYAYFNDYYGESGGNGAGLDTNGKPTNYSVSGLYGLTITNSLTVNGGELRLGENSHWDTMCPQLSFEANSTPTININSGDIRAAQGWQGFSTTTITVNSTQTNWYDSASPLWIGSQGGPLTVANNWILNGAGLKISNSVVDNGNITVTAITPGKSGNSYVTTSYLQLGGQWCPTGVATQAGDINLETGATLNITHMDGANSGTSLISGQITGDATTNLIRGRGGMGDNNFYTFSPTTGTNSGFLGTLTMQAGTNIFQGTWSNLGNVNLSYDYYTDSPTLSGNATLGLAANMNVSIIGGNASTGSYNGGSYRSVVAPTGGTLTLGTHGNGNIVKFGNASELTLNLNDLKTDGVTPVADSLAIKGNLDLGDNTNGTVDNVLNIVYTSMDKATTYTLVSYDSISSNQLKFGTIEVNGNPIAGDGTALKAINGDHHLVYGATSLTLQMELIPGDINGDGLVDVADYNIWAANVGRTGATWSQGDLNGDGLVDVADYNIWAANVGKTAATPEPISMIIIAIGGGLVALKRRNA
jgi:hypothetical protein